MIAYYGTHQLHIQYDTIHNLKEFILHKDYLNYTIIILDDHPCIYQIIEILSHYTIFTILLTHKKTYIPHVFTFDIPKDYDKLYQCIKYHYPPILHISYEREILYIHMYEILYWNTYYRKVTIYLLEGTIEIGQYKFEKYFYPQLQPYFLRIRNSTYVNMIHIYSIHGSYINLNHHITLQISRKYMKHISIYDNYSSFKRFIASF